jgi:hypothetical protein
MTPAAALRLVTRHIIHACNGDPSCKSCKGDGSVGVEPGLFARCACLDRIDEAYKIIGTKVLEVPNG